MSRMDRDPLSGRTSAALETMAPLDDPTEGAAARSSSAAHAVSCAQIKRDYLRYPAAIQSRRIARPCPQETPRAVSSRPDLGTPGARAAIHAHKRTRL